VLTADKKAWFCFVIDNLDSVVHLNHGDDRPIMGLISDKLGAVI
jgi:hypothetical protein